MSLCRHSLWCVDGTIRISALVNTALIQAGLERKDRLHRKFLWHGNAQNFYHGDFSDICLAEDPEGRRREEGGSLIRREKLQEPTGETIKHQQVKALNQQTHLLTVCFLQPITVRADIEHWGVDGCSGNVFSKFVQVWWLFAPVRETVTGHNRREERNSNMSSSSSNYNHGDNNVAV